MNPPASNWLHEALAALGDLLEARGLEYSLVVVGGAGLLLRGVVARPTRDVDVLGLRTPSGVVDAISSLPAPLAVAVADVGRAYGLASDWLNLGPASLLDLGLPDGFAGRLDAMRFGGLVVWVADRFDLACLKVYAAADHWPARDRHLADLLALAPTATELRRAEAWARTHDPSPAFAQNVASVLRYLGVDDGDGT